MVQWHITTYYIELKETLWVHIFLVFYAIIHIRALESLFLLPTPFHYVSCFSAKMFHTYKYYTALSVRTINRFEEKCVDF